MSRHLVRHLARTFVLTKCGQHKSINLTTPISKYGYGTGNEDINTHPETIPKPVLKVKKNQFIMRNILLAIRLYNSLRGNQFFLMSLC